MNYRYLALLIFFLTVSSCKKKEAEKELYPVEVNDTAIVFSNLNTDTVALDFALVRIEEAHTLSDGRKNTGFALGVSALLLPNEPVAIPKQRFVYHTLDTLRNSDRIINIGYNIREFPDSPARGIVKTFNKNF